MAILKEGQSFGDQALLKREKLRAARIVTDSYCNFGVLWAEDYMKCMMDSEKKNKDKLIEFIKEMQYFKPMSKGAISKIVHLFN